MNTITTALYQEVLADLDNSQGAVSQSDIYRKYARAPGNATDGLARDESSFNRYVWPVLQQMRGENKQISMFKQ
jgi:hypothetical protein